MRRTWTYVSRFRREEELARRRHSDQEGKEDEQKRRGEVQDPAKTARSRSALDIKSQRID
jgi:hypothetical protein